MKRFDGVQLVSQQGRAAARVLAALALTLTMVVAALPGPAAAATELVVNGSFEAPPVTPSTFSIFASIPGWETVFGCGIEVQNQRAGTPFDGQQLVELGSSCASAMVQYVPTVPGATYQVSFYVSPRPGVAATDNVLRATWDGVDLQTISAGSISGDTSWTQYSYTVVASGSTTPLAFTDVGTNNSLGAYIDLVSVTQAETIYDVCLLYDPAKPKKAGSVAPIKLQLCDGAGTNLSGPSLVLNVVNLAWIDGDPSTASAEDAGQANPGDDFRYDADLAGYIFNLDTSGLGSGTWEVQFTVNGGQHVYDATFDVK